MLNLPRAIGAAGTGNHLLGRLDDLRLGHQVVAVAPSTGIGYTRGMKTAISIADAVYTDAERLARRVKKSRSQLYTEAVAEYVARHDSEAVTEAMNRVCEQLDTRPDPAVAASARRILRRTEW